MIDAHAVKAHLQTLESLQPDAQATAAADWLQAELEQTTLQHGQDADGNVWITLPGKGDRSVVLGSSFQPSGSVLYGGNLGVVAGLETIKSVARREHEQPPCTLRFVVWAECSSKALGQDAAAYLELHVQPGEEGEIAASPLGVVAAGDKGSGLNPRLTQLCDEAIQELTGVSARQVSATAQIATTSVPAAVLTVAVTAHSGSEADGSDTRLHLLQAAEAFGRWTESTMHLVAGDGVDLWAVEHRTPNL